MAVLFKKPAAKPLDTNSGNSAQAPAQENTQAPAQFTEEENEAPVVHVVKPAAGVSQESNKMGVSFLKKGAAAKQTFQQEEAKSEAAKNSTFRYRLVNGGTGAVTFLDGDMADGILDIPFFYEHTIKMPNGKWANFICTQDTEPCPICESGNKPDYVGALTVIDHSTYTDKNGKPHKDSVLLYIAKRTTIKMLTQMSIKRGGLTGCRYDVARTGDKEAAVGNVYDFTEKLTLAEVAAKYTHDPKYPAKAFNYGEVLQYTSAVDLRKLGFGGANPIGSEAGVQEDYSDKM
jgi:hypothetical protein